MVADLFPTPYDMQCAIPGCHAWPQYVVRLRHTSESADAIAFGCSLEHLHDVIWATRHLGAQRLIESWSRRTNG
jgi:hypothetical protein